MKKDKNEKSEHWKSFALFFKNVCKQQGITATELARRTNMEPSTMLRFFNLEFCLRFDYVLRIIHALDLNLFFETQDSKTELNTAFEKAKTELGRRPDDLPMN